MFAFISTREKETIERVTTNRRTYTPSQKRQRERETMTLDTRLNKLKLLYYGNL